MKDLFNDMDKEMIESQEPSINVDYERQMEVTTQFGECLSINLKACAKTELDFYEKIKTLLEGQEIYKKFGVNNMSSK